MSQFHTFGLAGALAVGIVAGFLSRPSQRSVSLPERQRTIAARAVTPNTPALNDVSRIRETQPADLPYLCQNWDGDPSLLPALFARWGESDPLGALEWIRSEDEDGNRQRTLTTALFSSWADRDLDGAKQAAEKLPKTSGNYLAEAAYGGIRATLARTDPRAAIELGISNCYGEDGMVPIFDQVCESDPQLAARLVAAIPTQRRYNDVVDDLVDAWAKHDPAATIDWLPDDNYLAWHVMENWAESGDAAAREHAYASTSENRATLIAVWLAAAANTMSDEDFSGEFSKLGPERKTCLSRMTHDMHPDRAGRILSALTIELDSDDTFAFTNVADNLADRGWEAAMAWSETLPPGTMRSAAHGKAVEHWIDEDPGAALEHLSGLSDEEFPTISRYSDFAAMAAVNFEATGEMIERIEMADERQVARESIVGELTKSSPEAALEYIQSLTLEDEDHANLIDEWVGESIEASPDAIPELATWALSLDREPARKAAIREIMPEWYRHDPEGAASWVAGLDSPPPIRDVAVERLATALVEIDAEASYEWAATISDATQRASAMNDAFGNWVKLAPERAKARRTELEQK